MSNVILNHEKRIVEWMAHDSLFANQEDEKLTEDELKSAWEEYEREKQPRFVPDIAQMEQARLLYPLQLQQQLQMQQIQNHIGESVFFLL